MIHKISRDGGQNTMAMVSRDTDRISIWPVSQESRFNKFGWWNGLIRDFVHNVLTSGWMNSGQADWLTDRPNNSADELVGWDRCS